MTGPPDGGDHHAMRRAGHPRRVRLDVGADGAQVQSPPAASSAALVVARAAPVAYPAPAAPATSRTHRCDEDLLLLVELDTLDHRFLEYEQLSPYPGITHAVVPLSSVLPFDKPEPKRDNGM
jgi:hypothetical protein